MTQINGRSYIIDEGRAIFNDSSFMHSLDALTKALGPRKIGQFSQSSASFMSDPTNPPDRRCSFASAVVGSEPGCRKPQIEKQGEGPHWKCQTCGYTFSALIKKP
jgi:hypothetical protein